MLHELREIIHHAHLAEKRGLKTVLASVVKLDGSSYRRPGVRMSVREDGLMTGAVSGGCVEKEVLRQAESVFRDGIPKLMVYDGRYRLGCEGILYILIEPFRISEEFLESFDRQWQDRKAFQIDTSFNGDETKPMGGGSVFHFKDKSYRLSDENSENEGFQVYEQIVQPGFRLILIGAEHDAVELCRFAAITGWEVHIVAPPDDPKSLENFPGAYNYHGISENELAGFTFDQQTAVLLMTHSYVKDLKYLSVLVDKELAYLGILGPVERREKLFAQLLEYRPNTPQEFMMSVRGPSGINIGAETPQEIAISVIAEILSVIRVQNPIPLREKTGRIHK